MENFVADIIFIDAPASQVFEALVDPHAMLEWMAATEAEIGAWDDGEYRVTLEDGTTVEGIVELIKANTELRLRDVYWGANDQRHGPSRLQFQVDERSDGLWFGVRHEDLDQGERWQSFAEAMRSQWVQRTVALKRYIEGI